MDDSGVCWTLPMNQRDAGKGDLRLRQAAGDGTNLSGPVRTGGACGWLLVLVQRGLSSDPVGLSSTPVAAGKSLLKVTAFLWPASLALK